MASTISSSPLISTLTAHKFGTPPPRLINPLALPLHRKSSLFTLSSIRAAGGEDTAPLLYRKLGDSDLTVSEIMLGTMTFGEQNTEQEAHDMLNYAFDRGVNCLDTAEAYPTPMKKETQGRTDIYISSWLKSRSRDKVILATKVSGYSERLAYIRDNANILRVDSAHIKESVEKSLKRLSTDYIDLLQIHWPDRYVSLFGELIYDSSKWRQSVPFAEQLLAFQELINEGKVRYIGVSNETPYGVMESIQQRWKGSQKLLASRIAIIYLLEVALKLISLKYVIQTTATLVYWHILQWLVAVSLGNIWM